MMPPRIPALALVVVVVAGLTGTAHAAEGDPRAARDAARQEQSALAADLDVLEASEAELDAATAVLGAEVRASEADVAASRQAVEVAEAEIVRAETALVAARAEITALKAQLVDRAVDSFISPTQSSFYDVAASADLTEAVRKQAFISQLVADEAAVVDDLASAQEDLAVEQEAAALAEVQAERRRSETEGRLGELRTASDEQARVQAAIEERRSDVLSEIEALGAAEAELTAEIEQAEREEREREEAARLAAEAVERERALAEQQARAQATRAQAAREQRSRDEAAQVQTRRDRPSSPATAVRRTEAPPAPDPDPGPTPSTSGGGGCIWPTSGTVTSEYGSRWGRLHAGIDIAAPTGTPIYAAKAGTVLVAGSQSGYGNTVVLDHGDMSTRYAHQSRLAVAQGERVGQGDLIGFVGSSGRSTGPHLHFETRFGDSPRDPRGCLP